MFNVKVNLGFHKYADGDRSWMYESGDVLAHFKGVSIFSEATAQHGTCEKE
jgi:hypothetical protein